MPHGNVTFLKKKSNSNAHCILMTQQILYIKPFYFIDLYLTKYKHHSGHYFYTYIQQKYSHFVSWYAYSNLHENILYAPIHEHIHANSSIYCIRYDVLGEMLTYNECINMAYISEDCVLQSSFTSFNGVLCEI